MLNLKLLDKMSQLTASDLREARRLLGVDQVDFGRLLGLNRRTISRLECERYEIPVTVILSVRFLLSISGIRDATFTKSPIVAPSRPPEPPQPIQPATAAHPAKEASEPRQKPKKSGRKGKKKRFR